MNDLKWSDSGKKLARRVFHAALDAELAETMADVKARAAAAATPDDLWALEEHLGRRRREVDEKYDNRYSRLLFVFGVLLREQRIQASDLAGLAEDKRTVVARIADR